MILYYLIIQLETRTTIEYRYLAIYAYGYIGLRIYTTTDIYAYIHI